MNFKTICALTLVTTFLGASIFPVYAKPIANNVGSLSNVQNQNFRNSGNDKLQTNQKQNPVDPVRSAAEINMIELQSIVSKRGTLLQMTTQMLNSTSDANKSIIPNIGR